MADERDYSVLERNLRKMLESGASQQEMDNYLQLEGLTVEQFRTRPRPGVVAPETSDLPVPSEVKQPPPANVPLAEVEAPGVSLPPSPPPTVRIDRPTLAGRSLERAPRYMIFPHPGALFPIPSRYTQEEWDRRLQVAGVARSITEGTEYRPPDPIGPQDITTSAQIFGFRPQIRGIGGVVGEGLARWLRPDRTEIDPSVPLSEVYGLYRDAERLRQEEWARENPASSFGLSLLGGFTGAVPRVGPIRLPPRVQGPPAPLPPGRTLSTGQQLGVASSYGAVGGGLQGAAENPQDTTGGFARGAAGGAFLGPAFYLGLRGAGSLLSRVRPGRRAELAERAALWRELGIEPPPVATLGSGTRRVADYLTGTPWGYSLQRSTGEGSVRLQQALDDALRFGGGPRTATAAGEEAQALTRNALQSRRTIEELRALPREEVEAIGLTGARRVEEPRAPSVPPVTAEEVALRHRRSLRERLNEPQPPPTPRAPSGRRSLSERLAVSGEIETPTTPTISTPATPPAPRPPATSAARQTPESVSREAMIRAEVEGVPLVTPHAPDAPVESSVMVRQAQLGPRRAEVPPSAREVPLTAVEARRLYLAQERVRRAEGQPVDTSRVEAELANLRRRVTWARRLEQAEHSNAENAPFWESTRRSAEATRRTVERQRIEARLAEAQMRLEGMRSSSALARAQRRLERIQEQIATAQQQRFIQASSGERRRFTDQLAQARTAALHESTRDAEVAARLRNAQTQLEQIERARDRATTQWQAYELEAQAETIRRQARADAEFLAARRAEEASQPKAAPTASTPPSEPLTLPRSVESYPTQVAAAEIALSRQAPPVQGRLLGLKNDPTKTNFIRELEAIALEARGQGRAPGYQRLFSLEDESLHPGVVRYLLEELGMRPGQAFRPAEGRAASPQQRFAEILDILVKQRRGEFAPGLHGTSQLLDALSAMRTIPGVNTNLLDRITQAIRRDVSEFARSTPEGYVWDQRMQALELTRQRIARELEEPLRHVTGNPNPAASLQLLQASMREGGNLNTLRAFLRIAEEKGDRTSAVSLLLTGLRGKQLPDFVRNWNALTPEARSLLFQGPTQALGARLDRFVRAYGHITGVPTTTRLRDLPRMRNVLQGVLAYIDIPTAITGAVGQLAADRVLASRTIQRWITRVPLELGPGTRQWEQHLGLLSGAVASLGLEQATGQKLIEAVKAVMSQAFAETPPPSSPTPSTTPPGTTPPRPNKGSTQRVVDEPTQAATELPYWHRSVAWEPRESVLEEPPTGPDPSVLAGRLPRGRREPVLGQVNPSSGTITAAALRPYLPRGSAEMLGTVMDYTVDAPFQGGRMMAEGVQTGQPALAALGAFFASPPGMGLSTFIGLPGARRLALSGRGNAQEMLQLAANMEARGASVPEIQYIVSQRLRLLRDADFGTVTRLPSGQWAIELANVPARHGVVRPYEVRPLRDVRSDPLLFGAHPELRSLPVWHNPDLRDIGVLGHAGGGNVALSRPPSALGMPRVLEHEVQHYASAANRFPGGATPQAYEPGGALAHLRPLDMTPDQAYRATTDEWLARQSAERLYLPAEARRESPVVAPEGLITHFWGREPPSAGMARRRDQEAWTPALDARVRQLRAEGRSVEEIAQELGRTRLAVQGRLHQLRVNPRPPTRMTPEAIARVRELIAEGHSVRAAAIAAGLTPATVEGFIRRGGRRALGLPPQQARELRIYTAEEWARRGLTERQLDRPRNAEIIKRLVAGERGSDLAREYGVHRQHVAQLWALYRTREARLLAESSRGEDLAEAAQLARQARQRVAVEDALKRQGKSPQEIARELNRRFQEGVTAEEIQAGTVWWREAVE